MIKKISQATTKYLTNFLELQLVITLMSLPILIAWGLPISYMSPLSNLVFTPLLILFLWISCLFAICALLHINATPFAWMLDTLTNLWMWMLSFARPSWLVGFSFSTIWASIIICFCIVLIYSFFKPKGIRAICILTFFCICMFCLRWYNTKNYYQKIGDLPLIAMRVHNKTYMIDYGALCAKQNFYMQIDYTIIPALIKSAGITNIDTLVLCKPSKRLAKVALQFAKQTNVQTIIATQQQHCYQTLCELCKDSDLQVLPLIKKKKCALTLKNQSSFATV